MQASEANLLRFLDGKKQFQVPIFQRQYSWKKENCEQLWDDVLRVGENDDTPSHFLGSIVSMQHSIHHTSGVVQLHLIDGQQRLTTLALLLFALGRAIEARDLKIGIDRRRIESYYLFNADEDGELHYKQQLTKPDKETLNQLLEGRNLPANPSPLLVGNYQFFEDQLKHANLQVVYEGIQKLVIVDIALKRNYDNPQLIFESLNSKGVKLSPADLMRNYVLMGQERKFQDKLYETYWYPMGQRFGKEYPKRFHHFIRDYLVLKLRGQDITYLVVSANRLFREPIYKSFKGYVDNKKHPEVLEETIAEIDHYSEYYVRIALLKEEDSEIRACLEDVYALEDIRGLKVEIVFPFLLSVYEDYTRKRVRKVEMIEILRLIESYIFRRAICSVDPRYLRVNFAVLRTQVDKSNYVQSLKIAFSQMIDPYHFPSDSEFRRGFLTKDVYKPGTPNHLCNYLLRRLENCGRKEPMSIKGYTIEHVMPQGGTQRELTEEWKEELGGNWEDMHKKYCHTIGNLTLTKHNSRLSDRPFKEKRDMPGGYRNSSLHLDQNLTQAERWDEAAIVNRAEMLSEKACKIWIGTGVPDTSDI